VSDVPRRTIHSAWPVLAVTAGFGLALALVPPGFEVPQNDDWAYALTVRQWLETGTLPALGWNDPTLVFQVWWGGLFAVLFGGSYTALRASTLVLAWAGGLAFLGILRRVGVGRGPAVVATLTVLLNPLHLVLSYSFNTDVPYVATATVATWLLLRALDRPEARREILAGVAMACAYLIRQQGLILAALAAVWVALPASGGGAGPGRRDAVRRVRSAALVLLPSLVALVAHAVWLHDASGGRLPWQAGNLHPAFGEPSRSNLAALAEQVAREGLAGWLTLALLLVPLLGMILASGARAPERTSQETPGAQGSSRWWRPRRSTLLGTLLLLGVLAWGSLWLTEGQPHRARGWPYQGNYLKRTGPLGTAGEGSVSLPRPVWLIPTVAAPLLGALLLAFLLGGARRKRAPRAMGVAALGFAQFLPGLAAESFYDRYLLEIVPAASIALLATFRIRRTGLVASWILLAPLGALSLEWTRAYVDRSRAAWEVASEAVARGVAPDRIPLGFEWEGSHFYLDAVRDRDLREPLRLNQGFPWKPSRGGCVFRARPLPRAGLQAPPASDPVRSTSDGRIDAGGPPADPREVPIAVRRYRPFLRGSWEIALFDVRAGRTAVVPGAVR